MRNISKSTFIILIMSLFFFSCTKEKSNEQPEDTDFLPVSSQATWHYKDTSSQMGFTLKAIDSVQYIDGIVFHYYENIPDIQITEDTTYTLMGVKDGNYYVKSLLPQLGDAKLLILKEKEEVGGKWKQDFQWNDTTAVPLIFKIAEKGILKKVLNHEFKKVTHVALSVELPVAALGGTSIPLQIGDLYFAYGVGIIQLDLENPIDKKTSFHFLLSDFEIP